MTTPKPEAKKLSLKVLVDSKQNKVLCAEAEGDFVDVLFSFMTLPLGTIVRVLNKQFGAQKETFGSLNTLYDSLDKFNNRNFLSEEAKLMLLNPRNSSETECRKLKLNVDDSEPTKYFTCEYLGCNRTSSEHIPVAITTYNVTKCSCGRFLNREIPLIPSNDQAGSSKGRVFTANRVSFIVRDDLQVTPNTAGSCFELLDSLGVKDRTSIDGRTFSLGMKEIITLLKRSMVSNTPLSDIFLNKKSLKSESFSPGTLSTSKQTMMDSIKMNLKVMVHKSTKKVFYAQAQEDFVDFLFGLLTIPLGSAVSLLSGNTSVRCIDNLYNSISCLNTKRYFKSKDVRTILLNPKLPQQYLCKNQFFDLSEKPYPNLKYTLDHGSHYLSVHPTSPYYSSSKDFFTRPVVFEEPISEDGFVRGPAKFMVTDDLEITPLSFVSGISLFNRLGIPLCDVEEQVLNIGIEEALGILKASLSTTSALTYGLNLMSKKEPKQEKVTFV